ncbi:MAG: phenylalanine--tRNA ligase subunit beta [Myxococcota bacterium]
MRISCHWLSRHVDLSGVDLKALGRRFNMAVAEIDEVEEIGHGLDQVVVGHVLEVAPIEGKKVRVTRVDCGPHGIRTIVCGAPNVAAGQRVPVALPGQRLGDMTIAVAAVAGVESHGMICSESELGLSESHDGILVLDAGTPGQLLRDAAPIEDTVFVVDNKSLTHRPDCWGHRGLAREIAALLERPLLPLDLDVAFTSDVPLAISVEDAVACPRYSALTLAGIEVAPSPLWLRLLLARVGMRPINNVVDATNFVMLDLGNPLHAFDRRQIHGDKIVVRAARDGERFTTLDGQERTLAASDLVIGDGERGVALAGVMGGLDSEVKDDTRELVLEAANFDPARVRVTAQRLGLRTESSARFEKSLDPALVPVAARSFVKLLSQLTPGLRTTSAFMDVAATPADPTVIRISADYIHERLGHHVGVDTIVGILTRLDFRLDPVGGHPGVYDVVVPTWRATKDIRIPEDLVEEVGRSYGYDNIPPAAPRISLDRPDRNAKKKAERAARNYLSLTAGLDELQTYSFDDDPFLAKIGVKHADDARVRLKNPITAEEPCMRTSIVPHLLKSLEKNARGFDEVRIYEIGRVFFPSGGGDELPRQPTTLAFLVARTTPDASWFRHARGLLGGLCQALERAEPTLRQGGVTHAWAHPVRQATLLLPDHAGELVPVGHIAELHPLVLAKLDLRHTGAVLELDLDRLRAAPHAPQRYQALARFPAVFRDFAVVVPGRFESATLAKAIAEASPLVTGVRFLSVFVLPDGTKSLAFSGTFSAPDRTLTDAEVRAAEELIWASLVAAGGARRA